MQPSSPYPRLVVAGTHSGVGKTSTTAALLAAFSARGVPVQPFKVGPDYIDPAFHSRATGRTSRNLDAWLLGENVLRDLFLRAALSPENGEAASGLSVIEGVMGLFDGVGAGHEAGTAHVAEILRAPVVLTLNAKGLSRSAAAMVSGYASFRPDTRVAGVICNFVKSDRHYALIKESVETECGVPCLGGLPDDPDLALQSRRLGLIPPDEVKDLDAVVSALGKAAEKYLDLDALLATAQTAPPLSPSFSGPSPLFLPPGERFPVRLAVARDAAFCFYYQDNFDLFEELGAELVFFSPIADGNLPENIQGLYLGGGFPENFAKALATNVSMRDSVRRALEGGLPAYAEGGGMMYLCSSLTDVFGEKRPMVGFFPEDAVMTGKLWNFGYYDATFLDDLALGPKGTRVRVHEFHYSRLTGSDMEQKGSLLLEKEGKQPRRCGLAKKNVFAGYAHIHFCGAPDRARGFLSRCRDAARSVP